MKQRIAGRRKKIRKGRKTRRLVSFFRLIAAFFAVLLIGFLSFLIYRHYIDSLIEPEVTIETGSAIDISLFAPEGKAFFVTDVSVIDTCVPGVYGLRVKAADIISVTKDVILNITDTTAPSADPVEQTIYADELPEAIDTITNIEDLSQVTAEYLDPMPDIMPAGRYEVPVCLTDASGNAALVSVPFTVIDDHLAPLIYGPRDLEAFIGDAILYLDGIEVTDDYDQNPDLEVDTSAVDVTQEGFYPVTYIATDDCGNTTSTTVTLHLRERPERYYEPEEIYELARQVIRDNDICDDSMSDMQKAFRIVAWTSSHIHYIMDSDKCDWTAGAYDVLTTMYGDCFNYMAMVRAMLGAEGIESITIERYPINVSSHYWNLIKIDGKWYHCDACVFLNMTDLTFIFMYTDAELDPYNNSYDPQTLPEGVTVADSSVQNMLDYNTLTVNEEADLI